MADTVLVQRLVAWDIHRIYGYPRDGKNRIVGALNRANGDSSSRR
jgi:pyruvate dehydrogenase (quinone)